MKKLYKYTKGARILSVLAPIFIFSEVLTELYIPKLLQKIIDVGIKNGDISYIKEQGLNMTLLALIGVVGAVIALYCASKASFRFSYNLRTAAFNKIQQLGLKKIDKFSTSSLVVRLTNDTVAVQRLYQMSLRIMLRAPILFIGGIIMAININPSLSLVLVFAIPVLLLIIAYRIKVSMPLFGIVQKSLDRVNTFIRENLLGIRVVKNYVKEDQQQREFGKISDDYAAVTTSANKSLVIVGPLMSLIMGLTTIGVLWYGGYLYIHGKVNTGEIAALLTYITQILSSLRMLSNILLNVSRTKVSLDRITQVLDEERDIVDYTQQNRNPSSCDLEFKNVTFKYNKGAYPALSDISFKVNAGQTVAFLGGTGSGKTTLINMIPRLYEVDSGEILLDGVNIKEYPQKQLRDFFAIVPQFSTLFSQTVKENLLFGNPLATDEDIVLACKTACADEIIKGLPSGYDTYLARGGKNLSGGQKQRICIARALLKNPKVLILDDSLSAVDTATDATIRHHLKENYPHITTIIIAQRIISVKNADMIYLLDGGEIVASGTHKELAANSDMYKEIMDSQREAE